MMRGRQAILLPGTGTLLMQRRATPLNPRKLLHSKWTAVNPQDKEKHFLVTQIIDPEPPGSPVVCDRTRGRAFEACPDHSVAGTDR